MINKQINMEFIRIDKTKKEAITSNVAYVCLVANMSIRKVPLNVIKDVVGGNTTSLNAIIDKDVDPITLKRYGCRNSELTQEEKDSTGYKRFTKDVYSEFEHIIKLSQGRIDIPSNHIGGINDDIRKYYSITGNYISVDNNGKLSPIDDLNDVLEEQCSTFAHGEDAERLRIIKQIGELSKKLSPFAIRELGLNKVIDGIWAYNGLAVGCDYVYKE